jgi:diguanylate cyclase (GGDEF)-like protein/PAS domain S-box-containing protein
VSEGATLIDGQRELTTRAFLHNVTEKKRAEEALSYAESKYRTLVEQLPAITYIAEFGADGRWTYVSPQIETLLGFSPSEWMVDPGLWFRQIHPEDRDRALKDEERSRETGGILYSEYRMYARNGALLWFRDIATAERGNDGKCCHLQGVMLDVTERKTAEEALRHAEAQHRQLVESVQVIVWRADAQTFQFSFVSQQAEQILGYPVQHWVNELDFWANHIHPEDRDRALSFCRKATKEERDHEFEYRMIAADGRVVWFRDIVRVVKKGGATELVGVMVDITEAKHAEILRLALYKIAETASTVDELTDFYASIHGIVAQLMFARNFYIALYDAASETITFPYFFDEEDVTPPRMNVGRGLTAYVLRTGQTLLATPEVFEDLVQRGEVERVGAPSVDWLGAPLKVGKGTFGVLVVQSYSENTRYGAQEEELLAFVAQHLASAIQRKRSQAELRRSEAKYRRLFEEAKEAILIFRPDDELILEASPAACEAYGYSRDQLVGMSLKALTKDVAEGEKRIRGTLGRGSDKDYETVHLRSDGTAMTMLANASVIEYQGERAIMAIARDITERKRAEELERDRRCFLEMVAQNLPLEGSLNQLLRIVEKQLPGGLCSAVLLTANESCDVAASSLSKEVLVGLEGLGIARAPKSLGLAASRREIVFVEDIGVASNGDELCGWALACGMKTCWAAPVLSAEGLVLGILVVFFRETKKLQPTDREQLEMASRMAAVAIEHRRLTDKLSYQAQHDSLTGLPNRILSEDRLQQGIAYANRHGSKVAVLVLDLDGFKYINDTLGHQAGDTVLVEVADRLRAVTRQTDTVARIGGDEFLVVLTELRYAEDSTRVAQNCLDAIKRPILIGEREYAVSASIGISHYPEDGAEPEVLQQNADAAMYHAKFIGKNGFQVFRPEINAQARERLELMNDLRHALENRELVLNYQPQFRSTGELVGFEALLRWQHPRLGLVPPNRFIHLAEETGLIIPIGSWVLKEACRQLATWRQAGFEHLRMAVNVSTVQLEREDWIETVAEALEEAGLPSSCLELELTESVVLRSADRAAGWLAQLRGLGVSSAIDDFGTGYSSLKYLQQLPIDTLKIDRSFVRDIGATSPGESGSAAIVRAIVTLAQKLGMRVVAEGVETEDELGFLRKLGCDLIQGFLFAKPMSADACEAFLAEKYSAPAGSRP